MNLKFSVSVINMLPLRFLMFLKQLRASESADIGPKTRETQDIESRGTKTTYARKYRPHIRSFVKTLLSNGLESHRANLTALTPLYHLLSLLYFTQKTPRISSV